MKYTFSILVFFMFALVTKAQQPEFPAIQNEVTPPEFKEKQTEQVSSNPIEDLLKNPNITWIAEGYQAFGTDQSMIDDSKNDTLNTLGSVRLLKFVNENEEEIPNKGRFATLLFNAIKKGKITVYEDENCSKKLKSKSILKDIDGQKITSFKAKQLYYYNAAKVFFDVKTLAIAPVINQKSLFWIKTENVQAYKNLAKNTNITWASELRSDATAPYWKEGWAETNVRILKKQDAKPLVTFVEALRKDSTIALEMSEINNWREDFPTYLNPNTYTLNYKGRDIFLRPIITDTVSIFAPESYQEKTIVITHQLNELLIGIFPIQCWYWNSKLNQVEAATVSTAPMYLWQESYIDKRTNQQVTEPRTDAPSFHEKYNNDPYYVPKPLFYRKVVN